MCREPEVGDVKACEPLQPTNKYPGARLFCEVIPEEEELRRRVQNEKL
jgi:hypothetical protein